MRNIFFLLIVTCFITASCSPPKSYRRQGTKNHYRSSYTASSERRAVIKTAERYLGVKYKRGGDTPRGFDCSGYVMYVYQKNRIYIPRTAKSQYYSGKRISLRDAKPGDLVFFQTSRKRISHVGIYLGNKKFIHAPRSGKRVSFADINNSYWKKRYRGAVTYLGQRRVSRISF